MPRKEWTEEQRKAFGEKMRQARAQKKNQPKQLDIEEELTKNPEPVQVSEGQPKDNLEQQTTIQTETNAETLLNRAIEAIALLAEQQSRNVPQEVAIKAPEVKNGRLTGTIDRFSMNKTDYVDFTARLAEDPLLSRFGFKDNYELTYMFQPVRYQTIDGIWMQEPKITIDLIRKIYDELTGELTNGRYKEYRIVIHEDPDAAVWVAKNNGVAVPEDAEGEKAFLNEMRYLQVRDWLRECFMPKKPTSNNNRKDMVINGKLVEFFEVNSENSQKLPFDQLNSKL